MQMVSYELKDVFHTMKILVVFQQSNFMLISFAISFFFSFICYFLLFSCVCYFSFFLLLWSCTLLKSFFHLFVFGFYLFVKKPLFNLTFSVEFLSIFCFFDCLMLFFVDTSFYGSVILSITNTKYFSFCGYFHMISSHHRILFIPFFSLFHSICVYVNVNMYENEIKK